MNKFPVFLVLTSIGLFSCKNTEKAYDQMEIAKNFYAALDNSNPSKTTDLITKTFTTIDDGFEQNYSGSDYAEWVKWDSVFQPTYEILKIEKENGIVKAKISKTDKRISFLHNEPIITDEIIKFHNNKIISINRTSAVFKVDVFIKNRDVLVNWITENHPELNGFLNDQTKSGAITYLKAIELYNNKK